jgi:hypothetical protein
METEIRLGQSVKIVLDIDHIRETTDVRNSTVFDVTEKKLIIAQTRPPISKNEVGKAAIVTYLAKKEEKSPRYGFNATVLEVIDKFELSAGNFARAIALSRKSSPTEYNLRSFFRLGPPSYAGLEMHVRRKPVIVLDISLGGVKISHNRSLEFEEGKTVTISLSIDGQVFELKAVVLRTWAPIETRLVKTLEFVALGFMDTTMQFKNILGRKIVEIQRELRYKGV